MPGAFHRASPPGGHEADGPSSERLRHIGPRTISGTAAQNAYHFVHIVLFSGLFTEVVCTLGATHRPFRENVRPARGFPRLIREKVRPASPKPPILGCFQRAGRTFSRSHPPSGRAGRTNSHTGRSHVATLKPKTPLPPLTQARMKPPSPLLAPKQQPLKPTTPLQPKNTPKTPISHPQRRRRFQLAHLSSPQRRHGFQSEATRHEQRRRRIQITGPPGLQHPDTVPVGGVGARLRHPWAAARPGRATGGRPTLQTSSNQRDFNRPATASVTNVVNLSQKTAIFGGKARGLTAFVTTRQKSTRKTPPIDDVCNNTHRSIPMPQHARLP